MRAYGGKPVTIRRATPSVHLHIDEYPEPFTRELPVGSRPLRQGVDILLPNRASDWNPAAQALPFRSGKLGQRFQTMGVREFRRQSASVLTFNPQPHVGVTPTSDNPPVSLVHAMCGNSQIHTEQ